MLRTYLREIFNSTAYMTSDTDAIDDIYSQHHYVPSYEAAVCTALVNGSTDVNSGDVYWHHMESALEQGLCSWDDVVPALQRTLALRFRLGLFDDPSTTPYWNVPLNVVGSPAFTAAAQQASRETLVLLKNLHGALPFPRGKTVAIIGPHANAQGPQLGSYLGQICPGTDVNDFSCVVTPAAAINASNTGGSVIVQQGCSISGSDKSGFAAAVAAAQAADVVVLMMGIDQSVEGESNDRTAIDLPGVQHDLIAAVAAVGKPTALIIMRGGPVDISPERDNAAVHAIIDAGYPGLWGAQAIASAVFGDYSPGGRLATHIYYANYTAQIQMTDMRFMTGPIARSYRYLPASQVVYPFGSGISYSTFALSWAAGAPPVQQQLPTGQDTTPLTFQVTVTNKGSMTADDVVIAYLRPLSLPTQPANKLIKDVFDFGRVTLAPGASTTLSFSVAQSTLKLVDVTTGDTVSAPGQFAIDLDDGTTVLTAQVTMVGKQQVLEPYPVPSSA